MCSADDNYGDIDLKLDATTFSGNTRAFVSIVGDVRASSDSAANIYSDVTSPVCLLTGLTRSARFYRCASNRNACLRKPLRKPL